MRDRARRQSATTDAAGPRGARTRRTGGAGTGRIATLLVLTALAGLLFSVLGQGFLSDFTLYCSARPWRSARPSAWPRRRCWC